MMSSILYAVIHPISAWRLWREHGALRKAWQSIGQDERERLRSEFCKAAEELHQRTRNPLSWVPDEHEEFPGDVAGAACAALAAANEKDPLDAPLPCDITIGRTRIGKGCSLHTLVIKAQMLNDIVADLDPVTIVKASGRGREITALRDFADSCLDPERNGHAVSAYVRDQARRVRGIEPCETQTAR